MTRACVDGSHVRAKEREPRPVRRRSTADQHHAQDGAERHFRPLGAPGAWHAEGGDGVGDGLDASRGRTPGGESFQQQQRAHGGGSY